MKTMKEKQAEFRKKRHSEKDVTQRNVLTDQILGPKATLSRAFQGHLDYLLNLSAGGKKNNKDWNEMKKKLTEAGHWKKSYTK